MKDNFLGTWRMLPDQNDYQLGDPPQQGLYTIEADGDGYKITMQWVTVDNEEKQASYNSIPDGKRYPTDPATGVDSMSMTRINEKTLDSDAMKDGVVVAYATRILSDDGHTMMVKQSGKTPDGQDFTNTSVYIRQTNA